MKPQQLALLGLAHRGTPSALFPPRPPDAPIEIVDIPGKVEQLQPHFFRDVGSRRVKVKYGPFNVSSSSDHSGMKNFVNLNATPPCNNCTVISMLGGLEYPNGTYANANTGMWLHHAVVANVDRRSTSCPGFPELFFATGNERTAIDLGQNGTRKFGYSIHQDDKLALVAELMNDFKDPREAVVTIEWEFVPSSAPGFQAAIPIWLDVDGACLPHLSEVTIPTNKTAFNLTMDPPWIAEFSAKTLWIGSHAHDGGSSLIVTKNGQVFYTGVAKYGESAGYISRTDPMAMGGDSIGHARNVKHLSSIPSSSIEVPIKPGDRWTIQANYNLTDHAPMMAGSTPAPVMGIAIIYVVRT